MSNQLASEKVVVSAPFSFAGSAQRIWKITKVDNLIFQANSRPVGYHAYYCSMDVCCLLVFCNVCPIRDSLYTVQAITQK